MMMRLLAVSLCCLLPLACAGAPRQSTAASSVKEAARQPAGLSSSVRFTHDGRVEARLRRDGRLVQGGRLFGSLRPDWTFVSPRGVLYATLHPDGRLELAHGRRAAATIDARGGASLSKNVRVGIADDGRLTGMPEGEAPLRLLGLTPADRRAVMFVFFAWSMTAARIDATRTAVRRLRRTIDVARIRNGGRCPRSLDELVAQGLIAPGSTSADSWRTPYRVQCSEGEAPLVVSNGPDRRPGTADDIRSDR